MKKYNFPINNIPITKENYQIFRKKENFENYDLNSKIKQNLNNNNKKKKNLKKFSQYYQKN